MRGLLRPFWKMLCGVACALHLLANVDSLSERREIAVVVAAVALAGILILEFLEAVQSALWRRNRRIRPAAR